MAVIHREKSCSCIRGTSYLIARDALPVLTVSQEQLKVQQPDLEKALVKVVLAPEPYPAPGRAIRNLVARCLVVMCTRGETRTLFDTLQAFLKIVGDFKAYDRDTNKM